MGLPKEVNLNWELKHQPRAAKKGEVNERNKGGDREQCSRQKELH